MTIAIFALLAVLAAAIAALDNPRLSPPKRRAITCGAFACFAVAIGALTSFA